VKFIFDFPNFYADDGLVKDRGIRKLLSAPLKQLEGPMIREADKIVCLTHRARELLAEWYGSTLSDRPLLRQFFTFQPRTAHNCRRRARARQGRLAEGKTRFAFLFVRERRGNKDVRPPIHINKRFGKRPIGKA
jgi:hypothetical protein